MNTKTILLLDNQTETRKSTDFLLQLAGYEVLALNDPAEVINLLSSRELYREGPFCLVVNHFENPQEIAPVLHALGGWQCTVPVLILERRRPEFRRDQYLEEAGIDYPLFICQPTRLIEFVGYLERSQQAKTIDSGSRPSTFCFS